MLTRVCKLCSLGSHLFQITDFQHWNEFGLKSAASAKRNITIDSDCAQVQHRNECSDARDHECKQRRFEIAAVEATTAGDWLAHANSSRGNSVRRSGTLLNRNRSHAVPPKCFRQTPHLARRSRLLRRWLVVVARRRHGRHFSRELAAVIFVHAQEHSMRRLVVVTERER